MKNTNMDIMPPSEEEVFVPIVPAMKRDINRCDVFDLKDFGLYGVWRGELQLQSLKQLCTYLGGGEWGIRARIISSQTGVVWEVLEVIGLCNGQAYSRPKKESNLQVGPIRSTRGRMTI